MVFKDFLFSLAAIALVDFVWIGLVANRFYLRQFGPMAALKPDGSFRVVYWAAIGVYLLLALSVAAFVLPLARQHLGSALAYGALLGFCVYGVYDLTNHATLRHWPLPLVVVDWAWGSALCALVSASTAWAGARWWPVGGI